jgi:hypothetical protein
VPVTHGGALRDVLALRADDLDDLPGRRKAARRTLAPGVTWWGWRVPSLVEAGIVLALGLAMLAVAIFQTGVQPMAGATCSVLASERCPVKGMG